MINENLCNGAVRINKTRARSLYRKGMKVWLLPINANTRSVWVQPECIELSKAGTGDTFDTLVREFVDFHCWRRFGKYAKYFAIDK